MATKVFGLVITPVGIAKIYLQKQMVHPVAVNETVI